MKKSIITIGIFLNLFSCPLDATFGRWSISEKLFNFILKTLNLSAKTYDNKKEKIVLELGSGWGSGELSKHVTLYSIEHDAKFLKKYNTNYIHAPITNYGTYKWYNVDILKKALPTIYDLILVDGPLGAIGRMGFYYNLSLFNTNVPIIFDDIHRQVELELIKNVAKTLDRSYEIYDDDTGTGAQFGVILP